MQLQRSKEDLLKNLWSLLTIYMYELGFNSLCSNKRNLVAGNGASTPSGMSGGDGLPASACSGSTTLKPLWIVGRVVPSAMNVAT